MARVYDRYQLVKNNDGTIDQLPYVELPSSSGDKYVEWTLGKSRMDKLSQSYYGTPYYDWVILYANAEYISEFDIPDGTTIRIPFPIDNVISQYEERIKYLQTR